MFDIGYGAHGQRKTGQLSVYCILSRTPYTSHVRPSYLHSLSHSHSNCVPITGRCCLATINLAGDTSDAFIHLHGSHIELITFTCCLPPGRQPFALQPPQSFLPGKTTSFFFPNKPPFLPKPFPTRPITIETPNTNAMSSTLSYPHAKSLLSEVEKDRIVCTYLNSTEPNAVRRRKKDSHYISREPCWR